jgi:RND family efflux transporter MFP subunit
MRIHTLLVLATATGCLLSACKSATSSAPAQAPPEVGVITVQPGSVSLFTELPGRTSPLLVAEVRPQVSGILLKRLFVEGTEVKAGQVLYQIDPAPYQAVVDQAEASLESARLLDERYSRLVDSRAISQQDRDNARAQHLQYKAAATAARINLGYTRITAPISGRIGRSSVTQGALVTANQPAPLATVQQLDPIYVDIVQPATALLDLKDNLASGRLKRTGKDQAELRLKLEDGRDYAHAGKLQFSEVSVDESTGAVTLRAVFPNPDGALLPGMFVRAQLQEGVRDQVLLVPQRGITRDSQGKPVALVLDAKNTVQWRSVNTERSINGQWLVSSGLKAGERVVVDGVQRVQPGMQVTPVQANELAASVANASAAQTQR